MTFVCRSNFGLAAFVLIIFSTHVLAEKNPIAPKLGAASNFAQGVQPKMIGLATNFGILSFRDGMNWSRVEQSKARPLFQGPRSTFPEALHQSGASVTLVLNWGNPLYDKGDTPHSPAGIEAFGRFAAQISKRFPNIAGLEIGNEFNGHNFVRGPIRHMPPQERAKAYVALLKSAATQARAVTPTIRMLGGATHSIPAGYLWHVLDAGGAAYMDALAIHPYTTPAEQFRRQIAVLRRHPDARTMPIEITEFGTPNPARAAGHLLKNYCQFALAGVTQAIWYPLNPRSDGMVPLLNKAGRISSAGQAWRLAKTTMEGQPVRPYVVDPFTYGCHFGDHTLVLWGHPRDVAVANEVEVLGPTGVSRTPPHRLSATEPIVLHAENGLPPEPAQLAPHGILADSFDQFSYGDTPDGFQRTALLSGKQLSLTTYPGQANRGEIWTPYLSHPKIGAARLSADALRPSVTRAGPVSIRQVYRAPEAQFVDVKAQFTPSRQSEDGISIRITQNGTTLYEDAGKGPFDIALPKLDLADGDTLAFVVGPNKTGKGDGTKYRITLHNAQHP